MDCFWDWIFFPVLEEIRLLQQEDPPPEHTQTLPAANQRAVIPVDTFSPSQASFYLIDRRDLVFLSLGSINKEITG